MSYIVMSYRANSFRITRYPVRNFWWPVEFLHKTPGMQFFDDLFVLIPDKILRISRQVGGDFRRLKGHVPSSLCPSLCLTTVLSLTRESPYLRNTVFISRQGPGLSCFILGERLRCIAITNSRITFAIGSDMHINIFKYHHTSNTGALWFCKTLIHLKALLRTSKLDYDVTRYWIESTIFHIWRVSIIHWRWLRIGSGEWILNKFLHSGSFPVYKSIKPLDT